MIVKTSNNGSLVETIIDWFGCAADKKEKQTIELSRNAVKNDLNSCKNSKLYTAQSRLFLCCGKLIHFILKIINKNKNILEPEPYYDYLMKQVKVSVLLLEEIMQILVPNHTRLKQLTQ